MQAESFLSQAVVYLAAAVIAVPIAKQRGFGSVLGYLVAGVAIGPFGLGLVGAEGADVMHFAEFGVVMMLFVVGLELQPALLWRMRGPILGLGGLQVSLIAVVATAIGTGLGLPWKVALAIGLTMAMSSTAIVLQTLAEKGLLKTAAGSSVFAVLLFQDVAVIPILALLPLLAPIGVPTTEAAASMPAIASLPGWVQTLVVLAAVVAVAVTGHFLVRPVLRIIARTGLREMFTAATLLLVAGIALLMQSVGLSPALGTFLAGVVLANSEFRHELESDIEPFKGLLLGVFFIAVGAAIDFRLVAARPLLSAELVLGLVAVKLVVQLGLARAFRLNLDQSLLFAFALAQGGEFAFVLLSFAVRHAVFAEELAALLAAVVALSMALTPLLMLFVERVVLPRTRVAERPSRQTDVIHGDSPVIIAGFGRFGQIIGRLLTANGVRATVLDLDSEQVDVLRRIGMTVFYGDASRLDLIEAAGASKAKLFVVAVDEPEKAIEIVNKVKRHYPHLKILARARGRAEAYDLIEAGVTHVYRETFETALRVAVDVLTLLGFRSYQAWRAARTFRAYDEENVRELAALRDDETARLNRAREHIRDFERLLSDAVGDAGDRAPDAAWDVESLRRDLGEPSE